MSKTALVTGAASGIGAAITEELAAAGWRVVGYDRRPSKAELACIGDTTDPRAAARAVVQAEEALGPINALVNSAGYFEASPFDRLDADQWQSMLTVHLGGMATMVRAVLPGMLDRGTGRIVAIASELAIGGGPGCAHYAAAKGAVLGMAKSLAVETAPQGILVNVVAPGPTDTPLIDPGSPERGATYLTALPAGRLARPDEIAAAVRFVLEDGTFMVGEVMSLNSGAVI